MATKEEILSIFTTNDGAWYAYKEGMQEGYNAAFQSLRNRAAIEAMGRLIGMGRDDGYKYSPSEVADYAVHYADALVKALKRKMEE